MKALYKNSIAIILIVFAVVGFVLLEGQLPAINLAHLTPGNVVAVLGYTSVIMFVVEQFIEIFVHDPGQRLKKECKDRIDEINRKLERMNSPVEEEPTSETEEVSVPEVANMMKEKRRLENTLTKEGMKRKQRTIVIAFIIGLILSFSGFRLISGILFNETSDNLSEIQSTIIQSIDIILTAGIIAGGSDRMHRLIKRVKEAFQPENSYNEY